MDAPKCGICGKKEWNHLCAGSVGLSNLPINIEPSLLHEILIEPDQDKRLKILEKGLAELELIVDELLVSKRNRSKYMKDYMKKDRAAKKKCRL